MLKYILKITSVCMCVAGNVVLWYVISVMFFYLVWYEACLTGMCLTGMCLTGMCLTGVCLPLLPLHIDHTFHGTTRLI